MEGRVERGVVVRDPYTRGKRRGEGSVRTVNHVLEAKLLPRELWWKDQLFVFKKAPIGVGKQCSVEFTALNDRAGDVGI